MAGPTAATLPPVRGMLSLADHPVEQPPENRGTPSLEMAGNRGMEMAAAAVEQESDTTPGTSSSLHHKRLQEEEDDKDSIQLLDEAEALELWTHGAPHR